MRHTLRPMAITVLLVCLGGCSSVNLPKADILKFGEAHAGAKDYTKYPKITDAPAVPTDIRSDAAWDAAARDLFKARDGFTTPADIGITKSTEQIQREFEMARAKVHEYKKDDPQ